MNLVKIEKFINFPKFMGEFFDVGNMMIFVMN